MPIRVLVVDDQELLRQTISFSLEGEEDIEVVGEAEDGLEAVERTRQLQPDVVLMDVMLPNLDGVEATRTIRSEMPDVKVIALTMLLDGRAEADMREAGANGFAPKPSGSGELTKVIRDVMRECRK